MQNQQPELGPLERRIVMSVPVAAIEQDVEVRLKKVARTAKLPGFRVGKVPMKLVAQQYGYQVRSEAIDAAVNRAFGEKVREEKLRVAGYPRIEETAGSEPAAGEMQFSAVFEIYPEVKLNDLSGTTVNKPSLEVTPGDVDKTLDILRSQRKTFVAVSREAAEGDRVTVDFVGRKDGELFQGGQATDYAFVIGAGSMLPDFETAAKGLTAGGVRTFDLTFPEDYHAKHLAGQTVQFEITMKIVEEPRLPELDDAFAVEFGVKEGGAAALRSEIEANLGREVKRRLAVRTKEAAFNALLEANPVDAPKALVESAAQSMARDAVQEMSQRGMNVKSIPVEPAWFADKATRQVKLGLLISEVVKANDLYAKPEQVREMIEDFAQSYQDPKELIDWYYADTSRLDQVQSAVVEENVVKWILNQTKTVETPTTFDELMGGAA